METNKRPEVREVKETKKEEPEYTPLRSSSYKINHLKITTLSLKSTEYLTDSRTW